MQYTGSNSWLRDAFSLSLQGALPSERSWSNTASSEVVRTEEKNGIVQKFYRSVAYDFKVSDDLLAVPARTTPC
jgi:hypothetical protein